MNHSRLLIALLLLATVLVDAVVLTIAGGKMEDFPNPPWLLASTLQISQVSLMAIWLALGRSSAPWRLMDVVVGVALWSWMMSTLHGSLIQDSVAFWALLLTAQTVAVSVPLLVVRLLGVCLVDLSAAEEAEDSAAGTQRFQFSIRYLLGWMTALAVMLGTLKYMVPFDSMPLRWLLERPYVLIFSGRAVIAAAALWAALGTRWPAARIIVLPLACAADFGVRQLYGRDSSYLGYTLMHYFLEALLLVGSLWVFRVAGYRLSVRGRRGALSE